MKKSEIEILDDYIRYEFNYEMYVEMTQDARTFEVNFNGVFKPLEFFEVFYEKIDFINSNKHKPAFILSELESSPFKPLQRKFLYKWLWEYFYTCKKRKDEERDFIYAKDSELGICSDLLKRVGQNIKIKKEVNENSLEVMLDKLIQELNNLPDEQSRINFLKRESIRYILDNPSENEKTDPYLRKIRQQIKNRNSLIRLENPAANDDRSSKGKSEFTTYQISILFKYLFDENNVNCSKTKQSKIISKITGYSAEKIRQHFSNLDKKAYENFVNYEEDIKIVVQIFEALGLKQIQSKIERDLERLEEQTVTDL